MSDSDNTDVLLLIPPDLFVVASSDSDDNSEIYSNCKTDKSTVVSEIIEHMQSLETRISAIESKDSSNSSLNLSHRLSLDSIMNSSQTLPKTKFSVSHSTNLQKTKYPQYSSLPSTPSNKHHTSETYHHHHHHKTSNYNTWRKHENSKLFTESASSCNALQNKRSLHANEFCIKEPRTFLLPALNASENNICAKSYSSLPSLSSPSKLTGCFSADLKPIKDMSLNEVEDILKEVEYNDRKHSRFPNNTNGRCMTEKDELEKKRIMDQKLKFSANNYNSAQESTYQSDSERRREFFDITLPNDSFCSSFDTDKFFADFKAWTPSCHPELNGAKEKLQQEKPHHDNQNGVQNYKQMSDPMSSSNKKERDNYLDSSLISKFGEETTKSQTISPSTPGNAQDALLTSYKSCPSIFKTPSNMSLSNPLDVLNKKNDFAATAANENHLNSMNFGNQTAQRPHRLLTLSDFWSHNTNKTQEEYLRIKLEEEKYRREHCEKLIQDLQKKLLEQQEKVAVAVRVDDEKNSLISQFQVSWKKMKQRLYELESERDSLQKILQNISEKHQSEISDYQEQLKNCKEELSKALDLATGYKEKSDALVKEKVDLLKYHADELENYKILVQQAEIRCGNMKEECEKLLKKNQQTDETLKAVQQDLNKELMKGSEVRTEMAVIHKALDACETELTILRQEKENLQLKVQEEINRNSILEQSKASLIKALDEVKHSENAAKNEVKSYVEQQDKLRAELREVYQKQVDEVVKAKLQEFQTQLDSAETVFQNEIESKQRAIAECAARKIKSVIDKHQLEINLIEEKHTEEKRLFEIKVAQAVQKSAMLEAQLNSYRKSKNQLVEQLHSMMQKQWQQALLIISGNNGENLSAVQKLDFDKLFELPNEANFELIPNHCSTLQSEPMRLDSQKMSNMQNVQTQDRQNESLITLTSQEDTPLTSRKESKSDLKKYIKMILDMQQTNYAKPTFFNGSPPCSQKETSEKQSMQKDQNTSNEDGSTWQPHSELSIYDTSEYLNVPNKFGFKIDQQKQKPPWK